MAHKKNGRYVPGETPARYGLMRVRRNGTRVFMDEHSFQMGWSVTRAAVWSVPPTHYFNPAHGDCIVNFNKETSPVILHDNVSKSNHIIEWK